MDEHDRDADAPTLRTLARCFGGAIPAVFATADADGTPNVTYISRAHAVDDERVALSNQFMSKSSRNVAVNPRADLLLIDPVSHDEFRLGLVFERTDRRGPVFDRLRADVEALAELEGMQGVFALRTADIFRVTSIERIPPSPTDLDGSHHDRGPRHASDELAALGQLITAMARCADADHALDLALDGLVRTHGYEHLLVLLLDPDGTRLVTVASRGYPTGGIGSEVDVGVGQVGLAAARCEVVRAGGLRQSAKYAGAVRRGYGTGTDRRSVPFPGLADVDSRIAVPAMAAGELVGVLVAESARPVAFGTIDEHVLTVVAHALAAVVGRSTLDDRVVEVQTVPPTAPSPTSRPTLTSPTSPPVGTAPGDAPPRSHVRAFASDGSVFVDGEYLIKGVAGRILWSLLTQHVDEGRTDFTNRELRLDPSLELPGIKDNLESRLLLLRRRLDERCPAIRIERTGRGRFRLDVSTALDLEHRDE